MKNSLVALRYSKALINYSENKKASKKVYEEMKVISKNSLIKTEYFILYLLCNLYKILCL